MYVWILDEFHGSAVVVSVDELHARVLRLEPVDLVGQRLVVPHGEVVEPPEAVELVVICTVVATVTAQVRRHAPDGEVSRDQDRLRAEIDEILRA